MNLKDKKNLLKQSQQQQQHFENINTLRDDLVYALEAENQGHKQKIASFKQKIVELKAERDAKREKRKSKNSEK